MRWNLCRLGMTGCSFIAPWVCLSPGAASASAAEMPYPTAWIRQFGTNHNDYGIGVSADAVGNAYITGYTDSSLAGPSAGNNDAFVSKFNSSGTLLWSRQIGSAGYEDSEGVATDSAGNVYISGQTDGSLGGPNLGNYDAFLTKLNGSG